MACPLKFFVGRDCCFSQEIWGFPRPRAGNAGQKRQKCRRNCRLSEGFGQSRVWSDWPCAKQPPYDGIAIARSGDPGPGKDNIRIGTGHAAKGIAAPPAVLIVEKSRSSSR